MTRALGERRPTRPSEIPQEQPAACATRIAAGALMRGGALLEPHLLVIDGPDRGRAWRLGVDQTVGRGRDADLRLSDPAASRLHLRLSQRDGRFVAVDLDSKNGVRVNDRPCRGRLELTPGDELAIGATRLRLEPGLLDQAEPAAPPDAPALTAGDANAPDAGPCPGASTGAARLAIAGGLLALAALLLALP